MPKTDADNIDRWNRPDNEFLPVFAGFRWTLKSISSTSSGDLFPCYFSQIFMSLGFRKYKYDCNIFTVTINNYSMSAGWIWDDR